MNNISNFIHFKESFAKISLCVLFIANLSINQTINPPVIVNDISAGLYATQVLSDSTSYQYFFIRNIGGDGNIEAKIKVDTFTLTQQFFIKGNSRDTLICTFKTNKQKSDSSYHQYQIAISFPGFTLSANVNSERWQGYNVPPFYINYIPNGLESVKLIWWGDIPTQVKENPDKLVTTFSLQQNFPNPFNPCTTIRYNLQEQSFVTLRVFDVLGREVSNLVNERQQAGTHMVIFDGTNIPSGLYFYRLEAGVFYDSKKLLLLK